VGEYLDLPLFVQKKIKGVLFLVVLGCVWGSSFILMKLGMEPVKGFKTLDAQQVAGLRMLIAALAFLPFSVPKYRLLFSKTGIYFLIVGLCGNFIPSFLFTYAGTGLSSGLSGILNSFTPVFTALIGFVAFGIKIHRLQVMGIMVGILGIGTLVSASLGLKLGGTPTHILAILLATLLYGISVNTIRQKLSHVSALEVSSLGLLCILPFSLLTFLYTGTGSALLQAKFGMQSLGYVFILGFIGTAISNVLFNRLIKLTSALFASSVTYLIPIFAVFFGFILHESLTLQQLFSMAIILVGVFLVNFHENILKIWKKNRQ